MGAWAWARSRSSYSTRNQPGLVRPTTLIWLASTSLAPQSSPTGRDVQKERYLERILRGEDIWCEGFSEPEAGSDLANVSTRADPVDGGFAVSGQKTWTSFAHVANKCYLLAKTSRTESRHRNVT